MKEVCLQRNRKLRNVMSWKGWVLKGMQVELMYSVINKYSGNARKDITREWKK